MITDCLPRTIKEAATQFYCFLAASGEFRDSLDRDFDSRQDAMRDYVRAVYRLDAEHADLCRRGSAARPFPSAWSTADRIVTEAICRRRQPSNFQRHLQAHLRNHTLLHLDKMIEHLHTAVEWHMRGRIAEAMIHVGRACTDFMRSSRQALSCDRPSATNYLFACVETRNQNMLPVFVAQMCADQRMFAQAVDVLRNYLRTHDADVQALYLLATCYWKLDLLPAEQEIYRHIINIDRGTADTWNRLGVCLFEQKQYDDAIGCYRRALALRPNFALAYNNMGESHYYRGELRRAMACYGISISLDPAFGEVHRLLGDVYHDLGMDGKFLACYRRAAELNDARALECLRLIEGE